MTRPIELLRQGRKDDLWQMCCGFLDLSLDQFMGIQKRLLREQIELLKNCELGRKVMRGAMPNTVEEFREQVPLTTYTDYLPELVEKREDALPVKPVRWVRTSGKTGEYEVKWVPMSEAFISEAEKLGAAVLLLSTCRGRGDTSKIKEHFKLLFSMGPPEYISGALVELAVEALGCDLLPSGGRTMDFQQRLRFGFQEAMYRGLDMVGGLPTALVAIGEQFKRGSQKRDPAALLSHPVAFLRVLRGVLVSKLARRPILPKDLWSIKGVAGSGTDSGVYREKVKEYWGRPLLEMYSGTEGGYYALQTWDYEGMTFVPNQDFFEFISEREWFKWNLDKSYEPKTILLDEVEPGEVYEVVITNLHGGVMTRYRPGDMIRITARRNERLGIDIPQMMFERRADELIDIAGFGRLTERVIWEAIENTGLPYVDWTARKEMYNQKPVLHVYLELQDGYLARESTVAAAIFDSFRMLDEKYHYNVYQSVFKGTEDVVGFPIRATLLPVGTFARYLAERRAEGADLGHLKPPHINPSDKVLSQLHAPQVEVERVSAAAPEGSRLR
ncbi:MAG: GH3 family domain-containing protein [bacterium]